VKAPIAVALDAPDLATMRDWIRAAEPYVSCGKIGLEMFCRSGAAAVYDMRDAAPELDLFLDVKLHDIPATVRGAARALAPLQPTYLTVHASGGAAMVEAATEALPDTRITAVTVLTSLDAEMLAAMGWQGSAEEIVVGLARQSVHAGARAIVCSPNEVAAVRAAVPAEITLITPGVRPSGAASHDQARTATPRAALDAGADLLVIGRPITEAPDIAVAAAAIADEVLSA
jgi:orotidine-5'-phosphate decarboxylase